MSVDRQCGYTGSRGGSTVRNLSESALSLKIHAVVKNIEPCPIASNQGPWHPTQIGVCFGVS